MSARSLVALALAVALSPAARADEWGGEQGEYARPAGGYDVSVDLNAQNGVGPETFEQPLAAYGDWVTVGSYGTAWRPHVAPGWRPYYYGRWEWTNEGWLWVSDEPFGWATYHYGRWAYDPYYGWLWVPGYQWAPAWVSWRVSGDVVGWAPLAPGYSMYVTSYPFVDFWWTFVPSVRFVSVPVYTVAYAPGYARQWYGATAPAPAYVPRGGAGYRPSPAWGGPAPRLIEQRIGRTLPPARIVGAPAPGVRGGNRPGEIPVYRPDRVAHGDGFPARGPAPQPPQAGFVPGGGPGRGPGAAPAPGWPGARGGGSAPPAAGNGRGPGSAPAPGWMPRGNGAPPQAGNGRGPATAPAPGRTAPQGHGGGSAYVPAPRGQSGGQGGGQGAGQGGGQGGERRER